MKTRNLFIAIITVLVLMVNQASAQDYFQWRWSDSKFMVTPEANTAHCIGSAFLADFIESRGMKWWQADLTAIGLGALWEVKDGLVPYEKVPVFGSEGFSMMDLKLDIAGVVLNRVANYGIKQIVKYSRRKIKQHRTDRAPY